MKNWEPVLPQEFRDMICPKPNERIFDQVQSKREEKLKSKKAQTKKAVGKKSSTNKAPQKIKLNSTEVQNIKNKIPHGNIISPRFLNNPL